MKTAVVNSVKSNCIKLCRHQPSIPVCLHHHFQRVNPLMDKVSQNTHRYNIYRFSLFYSEEYPYNVSYVYVSYPLRYKVSKKLDAVHFVQIGPYKYHICKHIFISNINPCAYYDLMFSTTFK